MKINYITIFILLAFSYVQAQPGYEAQNLALDLKYKPGEVIVKFKDEIKINFSKSNDLVRTGLAQVDQAFEKWLVSSSEQLFRAARYERNAGTIRFPDGTEKPVPQFHNIFLMKYPEKFNAEQVAEELNKLEEVEYAEVNATAFIHGLIPVSEPVSADDLHQMKGQHEGGIVPNDPLYDEQWYLPEVKADLMWDTLTGDSTQVIAILDTGVDWLHPDLVNKIDINPNEILDGQDSDGNGYVDDIRGWDFVNNDNNPMDDNSHGTHCAGIAAAETDNGIGIAGVSWGAKIMPIKVFQSNGVGYVNQIAEGVWYAAQNGANIFSNSWGGYGESITIRLAFEFAYSKGPIIAAAGNNGYKIDHPTPPFPMTAQMFPASYNWVLGVEATEPSGWNAWFSNYDPTGPVIFDGRPYGSIFFNDMEFNYEVRAPGLSLLSTVPNGQYRYYSGTSMATPVVAGAVALMKNHQSDLSIEQIFAKLIQLNKLSMFQADVLDIPNSILNEPPPDLYFQSFAVTDSLGDQDGRIDAGEMVGLYMKIMNAGGHINNVWGKVTFAEFEDTLTLNFIDDSVSFGNISAYASKVSEMPITFTTNPNLTDGRYVSLQLLTMYEKNNTIDTIVSPFTILVENGVELGGNYSKLRLIPGVHYIVTDPCFFDTLIVDPGVTVKFRSNMYFYVYNQVKAIGSPDSMITFTGALGAYYRGFYLVDGCDNHFEYCVFENGRNEYLVGHYLSNVTKIYHSIFRYHVTDMPIILTRNGGDYKYNVFQDNYNTYVYHMALIGYEDNASFEYNIIANNKALEYWHNGVAMASLYDYTPIMQGNIKHNVFIDNSGSNSWDFAINHSFESINYIESNYWGTTNLNDIRSNILDFFEQPQRPVLEPINNLYQPPEECHGVVWKIEINVQNPQDFEDYLIIDDVMKVDVYFNRPMDTYYDPFVTFGVRFPFTQNQVIDSAYWSADSTVWTAYHTTSLSTGDGINTIRVAHARDTDHFEIPIERSRFKFVVQVAGSQSVDFIATPGISKVTLGWPVETGTDVLGYNFYRFQMENGYPIGDTLLINESLVTDSLYIDFEVLPDETYYYMFTQMKTDFSESDYSKVVSATPFSAANGDANGDMTVNVLDITTIVSYILNQNPEPFLSDAADVNYDGQINLLDIIGVVNLIMNQKAVSDRPYPMISQQKAYYEWRGHELWLHSEGNVAGLQFELALPEGIDSDQLRIKSRLTGFELATAKQSNSIQAILFSLDGKTIPAGESRLLELIGPELPAELQFNSIIGGELEGDQVEVLPFGIDDLPEQSADQQMLQVQPNPFSHQLLISWDVPEANTVALRLYDQQGRMIKSLYEGQDILGSIYWEGKDQRNNTVSKGVYILKMEIQHKEGLRTVERKVIFN